MKAQLDLGDVIRIPLELHCFESTETQNREVLLNDDVSWLELKRKAELQSRRRQVPKQSNYGNEEMQNVKMSKCQDTKNDVQAV